MASSKIGGVVQKLKYSVFGRRLQSLSFHLSRVLKIQCPYPCGSPLDRQSRKHKIDLIIFPTPEHEGVETPYICTVWDLEHRAQPYFPEVNRRGEWNRRERFFDEMLKRASYIITGTEVGKREICRFFSVAPERVRLLPHPTPSFALAKIEGGQVSEKVPSLPYIFYPAQFWAHKNHMTLLLALEKMQHKVNLVLVGADKGNLNYIRDQVEKLGLTNRVDFPGFVSRNDLIALYRGAVALVYPSLCGPENLPPLEAFALGCPVVAADIPGSREQLGENALLVRGDSPEEMAQAIDSLIEDQKKREDLIQKGLKRASHYTEKEFTRDLKGIIDEFARVRRLWGVK